MRDRSFNSAVRGEAASVFPTPSVVPSEPAHAAPSDLQFAPRVLRALALIALSVWLHVWGVKAPHPGEPPYLVVMSHLTAPLLELPGLPVPALSTVAARLATPVVSSTEVRLETRTVRVPLVPAAPPYTPGLPDVPAPDRYQVAVATSGASVPRPVASVSEPVLPATAPLQASASVLEAPARETAETVSPRLEPAVEVVPLEPRLERVEAALPAIARRTDAPTPIRTPDAKTAAPQGEADETRQRRDVILAIVDAYARAYERMDVSATKALYPSVNTRELSRAFRDLQQQRLEFAHCDVSFSPSGADAAARCAGNATYRPKVGPRVLRLTDKEWTFNLSRGGDGWQILDARMQ